MNYDAIIYRFGIASSDPIKLIVDACPWFALTARALAEDYYDSDNLSQEQIQKYLRHGHDFDSVDVSRIVERSKRSG